MGQSQGDLSHFTENQSDSTDANNEYGKHLPPINASNHIASNHLLEKEDDMYYHQRSRSSINLNNNHENISQYYNNKNKITKYDYSEPYFLNNNIKTEKKTFEKNSTVKKLVAFQDELISKGREGNGIKINYIPNQARKQEYKINDFDGCDQNSSRNYIVYENTNNPKVELYERIIKNNLELSKTEKKGEEISALNNSMPINIETNSNPNNKLYSSYAYETDTSKEKLKKVAYHNKESNESYRILDHSLNKNENNKNYPAIRYIPHDARQKNELSQKVEKVSHTQQTNGNYLFPDYRLISSEVKIVPIQSNLSNSEVKTINENSQEASTGNIAKNINFMMEPEKSEKINLFPQKELFQKVEKLQVVDQIATKIKETPKPILQNVERTKRAEAIEIKNDYIIPAKINVDIFSKKEFDENIPINNAIKESGANLENQEAFLVEESKLLDKTYENSINLNESRNIYRLSFDEPFKFNQNSSSNFFFNSKPEDSNLNKGGEDPVFDALDNLEKTNMLISRPIPNKLNPFKAIFDVPIDQTKEINKEEEQKKKHGLNNLDFSLKINENNKNDIHNSNLNSTEAEGIIFKSHYGCVKDDSHYRFSFSLNDSNSFIKNETNNKQEKIYENPIYETFINKSNLKDDQDLYNSLESVKVDEINLPLPLKISKNADLSTNFNSTDQMHPSSYSLPFDNYKNENSLKHEEIDYLFPINNQQEIKSQSVLPPLFKTTLSQEEHEKEIDCKFFNIEPKLKLIEIIEETLDNSIKRFKQETPVENSFAIQQIIRESEEDQNFKQNNKIEFQAKKSIEINEVVQIQPNNELFEAIENFLSNDSEFYSLIQSNINEKRDMTGNETKKLNEIIEVKKIVGSIDLMESNLNMPFNLETSKNFTSRKNLTMVSAVFVIDYPSKKITLNQINSNDNLFNSIEIDRDTSLRGNYGFGLSSPLINNDFDSNDCFQLSSKKKLERKFQSFSFPKNPLTINLYESQEEEENLNLNKKIIQKISTIKPFKIAIRDEDAKNEVNDQEKCISNLEIRRHSSTKFNPLELIETDTISEKNPKEKELEGNQVEPFYFNMKKKKNINFFQKLKKQKQKERSKNITINLFKWASFDPTKKKKKSYFKCLKSFFKEQRPTIAEIELDINYEKWDRFDPVQKSSKKKNYFAKLKSNIAEQKKKNKSKALKTITLSKEVDTTIEQIEIKNKIQPITYKCNPATDCRRASNQDEIDLNYNKWDSFDPTKKRRKNKPFFCAEQAKKKQRLISNNNQTFLLVEEQTKKVAAFEIMPKKRKSFFKRLQIIRQNERKKRELTTFPKKTHKILKLNIAEEENNKKISTNLLLLRKLDENVDDYQNMGQMTPTRPNKEINYYKPHDEENNMDLSFFSPMNVLSEIEQISPFRDNGNEENNLNEISDNYELVISESPDSKLFFDEDKNGSYNQEKVLVLSNIDVQDVILNLVEDYQKTQPLTVKMIPVVYQSKEIKKYETKNEEEKNVATEIDEDGKRFSKILSKNYIQKILLEKLGKYAEIAKKLERIFKNKELEPELEVQEKENPQNEEASAIALQKNRVSFLDYLSEKKTITSNDLQVIIEDQLSPLILPKRKKPTRKQFNPNE